MPRLEAASTSSTVGLLQRTRVDCPDVKFYIFLCDIGSLEVVSSSPPWACYKTIHRLSTRDLSVEAIWSV